MIINAKCLKNTSKIEPSKQYIESDTLIILDKLQDFPEIDTTIFKFFKIDEHF